MVMLSEFLRFGLVDRSMQRGRLRDLAVDLAAGDYPPVLLVLVRGAGERQAALLWSAVETIDWHARTIRVADLEAAQPVPPERLGRTVLLKRDVWDALVLDLANRTATLAIDLWMEEHEGRLLLRAADVSPWRSCAGSLAGCSGMAPAGSAWSTG